MSQLTYFQCPIFSFIHVEAKGAQTVELEDQVCLIFRCVHKTAKSDY